MLARENPHCGVSGVPFMKSTTGADATALSIAWRVSADMNRRAMGEILGANLEASDGAGRAACRKACAVGLGQLLAGDVWRRAASILTDDKTGL